MSKAGMNDVTVRNLKARFGSSDGSNLATVYEKNDKFRNLGDLKAS